MINSTVLVGRLVKNPDLKYTQNGTAVAQFTLAVNRTFTNQKGEREADFINCVIWRKAAENMANIAQKGSLVGVTGRIQTRNYENNQAQRVYVTEVVAENFQMLEPKNRNGQANSNSNQGNYKQSKPNNNGLPNDEYGGSTIDIQDDDLPL